MVDTLISARLSSAGLPSLANVQLANTGVAPAPDLYAAPAATVSQLSAYGQLLSASSLVSDNIENVLGAATNRVESSAPTVVTATVDASAVAASYAVVVSQLAEAKTMESATVYADPAAAVFGPGSFSITQGSNAAVTVTVADSSLSGVADAINTAGAGVTASVVSGSFGYTLQIAANDTGIANAFSLSAPSGDPFNQWNTYLSQMGLSQTNAAVDAAYTIDGVVGASASNSNIALAEGASFNILAAGSSTVAVTFAQAINADQSSVTAAATKLVQNYNALLGTLGQLTAPSAALNGDTVAGNLSSGIYNASNSLAALGISTAGQSSPLVLNATTLTAAFNSDATGTAAALTSWASSLHALISAYTGDSGNIINQATTVEQTITPAFTGAQADAYAGLSNQLKQFLLENSLATADIPPALPKISIYA